MFWEKGQDLIIFPFPPTCCGGRKLYQPMEEVMFSVVCFSFKSYFSSVIFQMLSIWDNGQAGVGRRQLVIMYFVRSGEGSVIDRSRRDDAARATRRAEKQEAGQDKNRRLGPGRVPIKGPAVSPPFCLFSLFSRHEVGFLLPLIALLSTIQNPFSSGTEIGRTGRSSVEAKVSPTNSPSFEVVIRTGNVTLGVVGR